MEKKRRTRGDRSSQTQRAKRGGGGAQKPFRQITCPYDYIKALSDDQVEAIHNSSLQVLEEIGIKVLLEDARDYFKAAGADVDESSWQVRFDRGLILDAVAKAPSSVTLQARNPAHNVTVGEGKVAFLPVAGPPNVSDADRGRRPGTLADFEDLVRFAQHFNIIHAVQQSVEPIDVDVRFRHLETTRSYSRLSDKVPFVFSRGKEVLEDIFEMYAILHQVDRETLAKKAYTYTVINSNSPLQLDRPMSRGIIEMAKNGQLMILTPFTLAGAMAPITLAGALVLQNAEALAGIALSQIVRPGAPVGYGGFTSNVDMRSGAPAFGTPEYTKAALAGGQLARRYNLPYRTSNVNASNAPDAQSVYESQMALWGALMGGCNILMHGAGWLEGGLTANYEKYILDIEMLQMMADFFEPIEVTEDSLGLEAIREVGPAGHFFGSAHTMRRFETEFYSPLVSDWRNFETWSEGGSLTATQRANKIWKEVLEGFTPPALDPSISEALDSFVERRKQEGGAEME